MKKFVFYSLFFCFALPMWAQMGSLKGTVLGGDGKPTSGAVVTLWQGKSLKYETLSSETGNFWVDSLPVGNYRVNIANNLHDSISQNVKILKGKLTETSVAFKVYSYPAKNQIEIEDVTVEEEGYDEKPTVTTLSSVESVKSSEPIKAIPPPLSKGGSKGKTKTAAFSGEKTTPSKKADFSPGSATTISAGPEGWAKGGDIKMAEKSAVKTPPTTLGGAVVVADKISVTESVSYDAVFDGDGAGDSEDDSFSDVDEPSPAPSGMKAGTLTAGEVSDFSKWKLWKDITEHDLNSYTQQWEILPEKRYTLQLKNEAEFPIANALVQLQTQKGLTMWTARTDNTGKAELWANLFVNDSLKDEKPKIRVDYMGKTYYIEKAKLFHKGVNVMKIAANCADKKVVDIAFVVDATGSMGDEIEYLKTELYDVINKAKDTLKDADLQLGSVFYRDFGDEYVSKFSDFTNDITQTIEFIKNNGAGGGGDTPEAVEEALKTALRDMKWRNDATSRMIFLILDAPPHDDFATRIKVKQYIKEAAQKGVRLIPIVCSGADKSTEYLMRTMALATNGTYLFLTDDSKVGGSHIKPTTDKFDVVYFNNLLRNTIVNFSSITTCANNQQVTRADTGNVTQIIPVDSVDNNQKPNSLIWKYYPNPTTGILTVEINGKMSEFYIADLTGKVLQRYEVNGRESVTVDISEFANGIYLIRYEYEKDKWMTGKVVLSH